MRQSKAVKNIFFKPKKDEHFDTDLSYSRFHSIQQDLDAKKFFKFIIIENNIEDLLFDVQFIFQICLQVQIFNF